MITQLIRDLDLPPVFYIDPRPMSVVSLVITDPYVANVLARRLHSNFTETQPARSLIPIWISTLLW